jgi:hypothetical protein
MYNNIKTDVERNTVFFLYAIKNSERFLSSIKNTRKINQNDLEKVIFEPNDFVYLKHLGKVYLDNKEYDLIEANDYHNQSNGHVLYVGYWSVDNMNNNNITILQAALQTPSGLIITLPRPNRHSDLIKLMSEAAWGEKVAKSTQGFLTSEGKFVNREEAYQIALKSGQIKSNNNRLYSEDLW